MQLSLFYDYERICRSSSFFQKFETLFLAVEAISDEKTLHKSTGRLGYGPICFLKALIYKNAQQIASIPELLRDLESRPLICDMIGFPFGKLPDSSNFTGSWMVTRTPKFRNCSIKATNCCWKRPDHHRHHHRRFQADQSLHEGKQSEKSQSFSEQKWQDQMESQSDIRLLFLYQTATWRQEKKFSFFWGYRTHVLVSKEGIPLVEVTRPNNFKDHRVAKDSPAETLQDLRSEERPYFPGWCRVWWTGTL